MGLGLQGAYGIAGGYEALGKIIAERKKDELLAQAETDKQRSLAIQEAANAESEKWRELQFTALQNERQAQQAHQQRQETVGEANRIESSSTIGDALTPDKAAALQQAGEGNAIQTVALPSLRGLVGGIGQQAGPATPAEIAATPDTGPLNRYRGTSQQVHQAASDALAQSQYADRVKRDAAAAVEQQKRDEIAQTRLGLAEDANARATAEVPIYERQGDGTIKQIGTMQHGGKYSDPNKLGATEAGMKASAQQVLPQIQNLRNMAVQLDRMGLLGPVGARWRDFVEGKIGSGELAAGSPEGARLLGQFQSTLGLTSSLTAKAHGGLRAAASPEMSKKMDEIIGGGKDFQTFMGALDGVQGFMTNYAHLGEGAPAVPAPISPEAAPGGTVAAPGTLKILKIEKVNP